VYEPDDTIPYMPGEIWGILVHGSEELDQVIDVRRAMSMLPDQERTFMTLLAQGQTGKYALHASGLRGNQTLLKRRILMRLTEIINGDGE